MQNSDTKAIQYLRKKRKKLKHKKAIVSIAIVFSIVCNMFTSFILTAFGATANENAALLRKNGSLMGVLVGSILGVDLLDGKSIADRMDESDSALSKVVNSVFSVSTAVDTAVIGNVQSVADGLFLGGNLMSNYRSSVNDIFDAINNDENEIVPSISNVSVSGKFDFSTVCTKIDNVSYAGNCHFSNSDMSGFSFGDILLLSAYNCYVGLNNNDITISTSSDGLTQASLIPSIDAVFYSPYGLFEELTFFVDFNPSSVPSGKDLYSYSFTYSGEEYSFTAVVYNSWELFSLRSARVFIDGVSYFVDCFNESSSVSPSNSNIHYMLGYTSAAYLFYSGVLGTFEPSEPEYDSSIKDTSKIINYNDWYNDYGTVNNIYYASADGDYLGTYNKSFTDLWGTAEDILENYSDAGVSILSGARLNLDKLIDTLNANFDLDISPTEYYDSETGEVGGSTDGYSYAVETALKKIDEDLLSFEDYIKALGLEPVVYKDNDGNVVSEPTVTQITEGDVKNYYITYSSGASSIGDIAEDLIVDEFNKLKSNVSSLFPFCLVFLLLQFFDIFVADAEAPTISIDTSLFNTHGVTVSTDYSVSTSFITYQDGVITLSLAPYETIGTICRASSLILFCVALVFVTKKFIFSSGGD